MTTIGIAEYSRKGGQTKFRYVVDWSSWFTTHPYNIPLIMAAVKRAGGTDIRTVHNFGWRNQPKVVSFSATHGLGRYDRPHTQEGAFHFLTRELIPSKKVERLR